MAAQAITADRARTTIAAKRAAAIEAREAFCKSQGFALPPLEERDDGVIVQIRGHSPDGQAFGIGYERSAAEIEVLGKGEVFDWRPLS